MHFLYSFIISQKLIMNFLKNTFIAFVFKILTSFYNFYNSLFENDRYLKNYTLVFIEIINEDLQH